MSKYIKYAIQNSILSETEIASKLNIDVATLKLWQEGARPKKIEHVKQLSSLLKIRTDVIIFSDSREPLDVSDLSEEHQKIVYQLYQVLKK